MDTAAVSYRIVDFLKTHPPFSAMSDTDLLALTTAGRVKFYEANDFILWQGEPHKVHVFVIQQGTVSLWDDSGERATLRDIRGAGDLLGIERFNGARACLQSAKAESDVLIYAFAEADFDNAARKVSACARVRRGVWQRHAVPVCRSPERRARRVPARRGRPQGGRELCGDRSDFRGRQAPARLGLGGDRGARR